MTFNQFNDATPLSIVYGADRPDLMRSEILADIFEASAGRNPYKVALIFDGEQLTYSQLDLRANIAASNLIELGVGPGTLVGLCLPRGIHLLVMQLAIAKTGAGWLPCDLDTPAERINICLEDAAAIGIVGNEHLAAQLQKFNCTVWIAEHLFTQKHSELLGRGAHQPQAPAYVIYTSGSTGKPKGIMINQASICHFLRSENEILGVKEEDIVYQGFSVAFDMSFEEIWISYLVGATLWIAPKEVATNPEELPQALLNNNVSVLHAVPTLLALFNQDVPSLRIINLGGEMCPESLVTKWDKPVRKIFNTYGPTEATVSASLAQLKAGEPVTIGTPLPNYSLLVIDADVEKGLRVLPQGETGELCISGPGIADGYLGRAQLTAEKFLINPWAVSERYSRLYRTGDLARLDDNGQVHCLGRADDQIKIRGFRVELGEIEAALCELPAVGTAAVIVQSYAGQDHLVAFIVADAELNQTSLRKSLSARLPPYMVPTRFEYLLEMPRLLSGKIDRKALKALPLARQTIAVAGGDIPSTPGEFALFKILEGLFPGEAIYRTQDFFNDLGGHSLLAAELASSLRADTRFEKITLRDIYKKRLVGEIAALLDELLCATATSPESEWTPPPELKRWLCGIAQALTLPILITLRMAQWLAPFFTYHFFTGEENDSILFAVAASIGMFVFITLFEFGFTLAGKWLILGRIKVGRYPLWGFIYFRWWLVDRLISSTPTYLLSGSSLYSWWLRALGAKIGRDVQLGSMTLRAPDLLKIDDFASVGNAVNFENARVERGELIVGTIHLHAHAYVGSYSVVEGNTSIKQWGHLEAQSALVDGQTIAENRIWTGSPAQDIGAFDPTSLPSRIYASHLRKILESIYFMVGALLTSVIFFLPVFPTFMAIDWLDEANDLAWMQSNFANIHLLTYFVFAIPASALLVIFTMLLSAAIRWCVLPRMRAGSSPVHSALYCRKWLVNQIQENSLQVLHGIYATIYSPYWYRLLGAKVGRNVEISTALGVIPDMLTLGDETFIADAVMLGDEEIDGGWMKVEPTLVGQRSFIGNGAYIPDGTSIPDNMLIGVLSRPPTHEKMSSGDTWLGTPPINLPARETTQGFPAHLTFSPSLTRRLARGLIEAFRIIAPHALVIAVGYTIVLDVMPAAANSQWINVICSLGAAGICFSLGTFLFVAALKWLLIGRYKKNMQPMWTPFVWFSETITNLYESLAVPNFMNYLRGTPWLPVAFRFLGCKIGRGVYLDTTDLTEFDCVEIGDHSELNAFSCPQTHLFEDRVMKIDRVVIGAKVYIGPRSIVLYGAKVGDGAKLGALTLVMKGENIPAKSSWRGCPANPN
jgi:non-ribosomal peptide synthetase-like protein